MHELIFLARRYNGSFHVIVEARETALYFEAPGLGRFQTSGLQYIDCLAARLLDQLGHAGVVTHKRLLDEATPAQREQLRDLVTQYHRIRELVRLQAHEVEPRLAAPRSSLDLRTTLTSGAQ